MKKHKKKRNRFKMTASSHTARQDSTTVSREEIEEVIQMLRRAEKQVIPKIQEMHLPPNVALFLLTEQMYVLLTGESSIPNDYSGRNVLTNVLTLWKLGLYAPSPEYPYTLEETRASLQQELKAQHEYAEYFQPFIPSKQEKPFGFGQLVTGLVKHPETHLWQVWVMIEDGPCLQVAAFNDPLKAKSINEELLRLARQGVADSDFKLLYQKISRQGDGIPRQIPADMLLYLNEHIDSFVIEV